LTVLVQPADALAGARPRAAPVIDIRGVVKRFGASTVLERCSLSVQEGEILTLLGPSGCGKTTLLRCIAGFLTPDDGAILIDGRDTAPVPVNRRPVGVVFQNYALFPHLTVAGNVGYGLRMRGLPRPEIIRRVAASLATVSLTGFEGRYPSQLSGGQQQRVAVARVLVLEPRVLLLDEPFSALDAKLRASMQLDLRALIKRLHITAIFVTHDQEEALTLSDRIALMRAGRIEQHGTPEEIYDRPASVYVADFIGTSNFWDGNAAEGAVTFPDGQAVPTALSGAVRVLVRPHNIDLAPAGTGRSGWTGIVRSRRYVGALLEYEIEAEAGATLRAVSLKDEAGAALASGDRVVLRLRSPAACTVFSQP